MISVSNRSTGLSNHKDQAQKKHVWRGDHVIVQTTQYVRQIRPDVGIIAFHDQNGLGFLSADYGLMHFNNFVWRVSPQPGKVNFDCGA